MTLVRKTVTLPAETVEAIDALSGGNFSAFTAEALEHAVRLHHLREFVADYEREFGAISEADTEAARRKLRGE